MPITAEERVNMFGYSDEEEEEFLGFQAGDKSDLDIVQYSSEKSESEGCNSEEEGEWSEDLENFDLKAFDPSDSGIKVQVLDGSEALFFFTLTDARRRYNRPRDSRDEQSCKGKVGRERDLTSTMVRHTCNKA